jgi:putative DNA primase/helicase
VSATTTPKFDAVPQELREQKRWVVWSRSSEPPKKPLQSRDPRRNAASDNPATWSTFAEAAATVESGRADGIGFEFAGSDYTGIDLDHCLDPKSGELHPAAARIVKDCPTYWEVSPSGMGLHGIMRASKPAGAGTIAYVDGQKIEIYARQYFTMTGSRLGDVAAVRDCQHELDQLCARLWPAEDRENEAPAARTAPPTNLDDDALVAKMLSSRNGHRVDLLWHGDLSGHNGNQNSADLAFCNHLAWWTNGNAEQMDRLVRRSALMRPKWDEKHFADGRTYGQATIEKAVERNIGKGYGGVKATQPAKVTASGNGSKPAERPCRTPPEAEASPYGGKAFCVLRRVDVTLSRPEFLMPGRIVRGSLAVIGGKQGEGKGKMVRDLIARATRGGPWPTDPDTRFKPMICVDFNAEDNPSETIFPEYEAAGADLERVVVVHRRADGKFPNFCDPEQLEQMAAMIRELRADIVTIDPVGHFFPGLKFNETESVLEKLGPLMRLAEETRAAVIPVTHFNKAATNDALAKFLGSVQWTAIARSALGVVADPDCKDEDRERRQLWTVKSNLAPKRERKPWGFELVSDSSGIVRVQWDPGPATTSEAAAFKLEGGHGRSGDTQQDRARLWLLDHFKAGETYPASQLYKDAKAAGHENWAVKKALRDTPEFDFVVMSRGYRAGTGTEWYLAGTRPTEEGDASDG